MKWMVGGWALSWWGTATNTILRRCPLRQGSVHHQQASSIWARKFSSTDTANGSNAVEIPSDDDLTTASTVYQELATVAAALRDHDVRYYDGLIGQGPIAISDDEYDALAAREATICRAHPTVLEEYRRRSGLGRLATRYDGRVGSDTATDRNIIGESSPTHGGAVATATATLPAAAPLLRRHAVPLLSLDNVHDPAQLLAWLERVRKRIILKDGGGTREDDDETTITILSEPKLDGLSVALRYGQRDGDGVPAAIGTTVGRCSYLQWAATRGDGTTGTDVTVAMRSILANSPQQLPYNDDDSAVVVTEVRGEVILPPAALSQVGVMGNFTNARNAAVGILLRKNKEEEEEEVGDDGDEEKGNGNSNITTKTTTASTTDQLRQLLRFYAYDTVPPINDMRTKLQQWGFAVPEPAVLTTLPFSATTDEPLTETQIRPLLEYTDQILALRTNDGVVDRSNSNGSNFDTDGCVHKVVSLALRERLGSSRRAPRWAVAHKFPPRAAVTTLHDIIVQVGRTGVLTPVAILAPVAIAGVTIQRATLHNFDHLQHVFQSNTTIPRNSTVLIRRAGDVIPQVVSVVFRPTTSENETISLVIPHACPACGSPTIVDDDVKAIRCGGAPWDCSPQAVAALQHAFSRDALDLKGLSSAKLAQLRTEGYLQQPSDVFEFTKNQTKLNDLKELAGWGEKSVDKLAATANQIAEQGVPLTRFLYSLGIPSLGIHAARLLAEIYGNWAALHRDLEEASHLDDEAMTFALLREDTDQTKGIGPILLSHLYRFSRNRRLLDAARALATSISIIDVVIPPASLTSTETIEGPFSTLTVAFSGSISKELPRKDAEQLARRLGAKATPTKVTKATGLVVVGARGGAKRKEAERLGVKVMSGDEFLRLVAEHEQRCLAHVSLSSSSNVEATDQITSMSDQTLTTSANTIPFRNMSVVFSGAVAKHVSRQKAQEWARQLGATSSPSQITKSSGWLVVGAKAAPSKVAKAEALGIPVMDAEAFLRIVSDLGLDCSNEKDKRQ